LVAEQLAEEMEASERLRTFTPGAKTIPNANLLHKQPIHLEERPRWT
jgi:hypothetical protein